MYVPLTYVSLTCKPHVDIRLSPMILLILCYIISYFLFNYISVLYHKNFCFKAEVFHNCASQYFSENIGTLWILLAYSIWS